MNRQPLATVCTCSVRVAGWLARCNGRGRQGRGGIASSWGVAFTCAALPDSCGANHLQAELEGKFHDEGKAVESKDDVVDSGSDSDTDDEDRKAEDAALAGRLEAYFLEDPFKTGASGYM